MAGYMEPLPAQRFHQVGVEFIEKVAIERRGQIAKRPGLQAAKMIMGVAAAIIAGWATGVRKFVGQVRIHQRLQRLVDGCQADVGKSASDRLIDLLGCGMLSGRAEVFEYGRSL